MIEGLDEARRELMHRRSNNLEVFLYWYHSRNILSILLVDEDISPAITTEFLVPNDQGLAAFNHPFAYMPDGTPGN